MSKSISFRAVLRLCTLLAHITMAVISTLRIIATATNPKTINRERIMLSGSDKSANIDVHVNGCRLSPVSISGDLVALIVVAAVVEVLIALRAVVAVVPLLVSRLVVAVAVVVFTPCAD